MSFSAASLGAILEAHLPSATTGLAIALSGGMDSAVLLAALCQWRAASEAGAPRLPVRAVHVNHGLQPAAADFARACAELCRRLDVPVKILDVNVDASRGVSVEAAARDARYAALALDLADNECLLTAHHALDQAETVLLQLLRGAGLKGMSAMPYCRPLGLGWHVRPLLEVAKRDLAAFGEAARISAIDDPMNLDARFDRAYLRAQVWPVLERRWPGAALALSRAARHAADAQELLDEAAALAAQALRDGDALSVVGLRALRATQQHNVVRHWIAARAVTPPSTARLAEALRQIMEANEDHLPTVAWGEHALRRYRDRLFLTAASVPRMAECLAWPIGANRVLGPSKALARGGAPDRAVAPDCGAPRAPAACLDAAPCLDLGDGLGMLRLMPRPGGLDAARLPQTLTVRRRQGGETLRPHPRAKTQSVQHLCQSLGLLPWMRDALPLVFAGDALVAVGDLWQDARWCVAPKAPGFGCKWLDAPVLV